ncbi:MAG TPA: trimeric intracellular cation channel family protein [Pseudomonadales bacterium]|nr:trimeric intracellular cation channel family protein [Pseudomonadales bacterium]
MQDLAIWMVLDTFGIFVFALSGGLAAARRRLDPFGFLVLAFLPAVGGGTLRDLILDRTVFWIDDPLPLYLTALAALLTWFFSATVARRERLLIWFDALGLSVFAVLGARRGLLVTGDPAIAVMMGVMTAVVGGVLRDVVCNELPLILHREIYATAAVVGALVYVLGRSLGLESDPCMALGALSAFCLRAAGILRGWSLPSARG